MLKIIVIGAAGRMGSRVVALAEAADDIDIVGAVIRPDDPRVGDDAGLVAGTGVLGVPLTADLPDVAADVAIDFSSPAGTRRLAPVCAERHLPLVVATTGLSIDERTVLAEAARRVAIVVAPNLSIGVAVLSRLAREAASALGLDADVEIVEAHHRRKKDAPSGTALHLARAVAEGRGQDPEAAIVHGESRIEGRSDRQIFVHALRMGDVVGEHTIAFGFGSERIELVHKAHSRDVFAQGALRAARFVAKARPGLYGIHDVVG